MNLLYIIYHTHDHTLSFKTEQATLHTSVHTKAATWSSWPTAPTTFFLLISNLIRFMRLFSSPMRHLSIRHASERVELPHDSSSMGQLTPPLRSPIASRSQEEAREHQRRKRTARLRDKEVELERIISLLTPPHDRGPEAHVQVKEEVLDDLGSSLSDDSGIIDWSSLPKSCAVSCRGSEKSLKAKLRIERKRAQVESFLLTIQSIQKDGKDEGLKVVDFGCGSGNLLLPLALQLPTMYYHGLDNKSEAIHLLRKRVEEGGLRERVSSSIGRIEDHEGSFDLALILHVCGSGTDAAIRRAMEEGAAFICSPCCIGKIDQGALPSSQWMRGCLEGFEGSGLTSDYAFRSLATAADISSHTEGAGGRGRHNHPYLASVAKMNIELDRMMAVKERGSYHTLITRVLRPHLLPTKTELLIAVPTNDERFKWPYD